MSIKKIKNSLILIVFLLVLIPASYNNNHSSSMIPIFFVTSAIKESEESKSGTFDIKQKITSFVKKIIELSLVDFLNIYNQKNNFKRYIKQPIEKQKTIVLNRGSPLFI